MMMCPCKIQYKDRGSCKIVATEHCISISARKAALSELKTVETVEFDWGIYTILKVVDSFWDVADIVYVEVSKAPADYQSDDDLQSQA